MLVMRNSRRPKSFIYNLSRTSFVFNLSLGDSAVQFNANTKMDTIQCDIFLKPLSSGSNKVTLIISSGAAGAIRTATQAIPALICWKLWKARCALRYGNKRTIVTTICNEVLFHLKVYFTRNNFHNNSEFLAPAMSIY
ncbi:uncharacterized protein LOC132623706 [Lycium barbarum]|uniref:uncharacterized protein LOC132623706 n=1 Tax=Lycium barbarum TaxID=112863 RepID=UPI00293F124A|nr:uncharacterized protein LOC132623706 [Lycium barbarum]